MLRTLGHLGLWPGLYGVAAVLHLWQLSGLTAAPTTLAAACVAVLFMTTSAYIFDRVKLRSAWIDPGDTAAEPERYGFLEPRAGSMRALALSLLFVGGAIGLAVSRWAPVAAAAVLVGVTAYAPRGRGAVPRIKDIVWLKNAYVALAFTALAVLVALALGTPADSPRAWATLAADHARVLLTAGGLLAVRVFADAALCDLDDEPADRRHGTATLPTTIGPSRTWRYAGVVRLAMCAAIAAAVPCPLRARIVWTVTTALGMAALRARPYARVSDLVDGRFAVEGAIATITLALWR